MSGLFAAELLKLRTVRSTWGFLAAVVLLAGLVAVGTIGSESELGRFEPGFQRMLLIDGTSPAVLIGLLLGCIVVTNEFRHGTITPTLLVLPRRDALLALKIAAGAAGAVALAVLAILIIVAIGAVWLTVLDVDLEATELGRAAGRGLLAAALVGALGAAVGGVVQSQVAALVGIVVWMFVAEPIVWAVLGLLDLEAVPDYLPAATVLSLTSSGDEGPSFATTVAVCLGWTAVGATLAWLRLRRRDIT